MASGIRHTELRLVVLGQAGAGQGTAGVVSTILGLPASQPQPGDDVHSQHTAKHTGQAAGRQVVVVTSLDWFSSDCDLDETRHRISSMMALSSPGPHVFLLCVPVTQPAHREAQVLGALEKLFGPSAVSGHTVVLFTDTHELLEEGEELEEHLVTWRKDLLDLVARCGDRYHTLERRGGEADERQAMEELLEKVEQAVRESGAEHFTCPLYQEAEARVRERQAEILRQRREEQPAADPCPEEEMDDAEMERVREEAEKSIDDLNVDVDAVLPSTCVSPVSPAPSFLWGLWEKLIGWMKTLPKLVRREALVGALVGLFVGGPFGGMLGATVGSVATEVGRRKTQKNK